jgi:hypothetical protein
MELGEDERLLLHAAGELPAAEARALEVRLASDIALKARFDAIREADDVLFAVLGPQGGASHDEVAASDWAKRRVVDRVSNAIREASVVAASTPKPAHGWRINRYVATGAIAAMLLVGFAVWVSMTDFGMKFGTGSGDQLANGDMPITNSAIDDPTPDSTDIEEVRTAYAVANSFATFDEPTLDSDQGSSNRNLQYLLFDSPGEASASSGSNSVTN